MKTINISYLALLLICNSVFAIDWPAYHRANITTDSEIGNLSVAELNANRIITNKKINCVSDWTIVFFGRHVF